MGNTYNRTIDVEENNSEFLVKVPKPSVYYLNDFINLKCSPDLLVWRMFPNVKEISESVGGYYAILRTLKIDPTDESVMVLCVGDGHKPRTGAMCALRSKWEVISIDPALKKYKEQARSYQIRRLGVIDKVIEDVNPEELQSDKKTYIILGVHSHASLKQILKKMPKGKIIHIISMPCCKRDDLDIQPDESFNDEHIMSPHRTINVYREVKYK